MNNGLHLQSNADLPPKDRNHSKHTISSLGPVLKCKDQIRKLLTSENGATDFGTGDTFLPYKGYAGWFTTEQLSTRVIILTVLETSYSTYDDGTRATPNT